MLGDQGLDHGVERVARGVQDVVLEDAVHRAEQEPRLPVGA